MLSCNTCNEEKYESEFVKTSSKRGYSYKCKSCVNDYSKQHYKKNKESYNKRHQNRKEGHKQILTEIKSNAGCKMCGDKRHYVLDFHHEDPQTKEFSIGENVHHSIEKVLEETKKCIVVCSNCHRELHYFENKAGSAMTANEA